jgi:hypothetical protein
MSTCAPEWLNRVEEGYLQDPYAHDIIDKLIIDATIVSPFTFQSGLLCYILSAANPSSFARFLQW